MFTSIDDLKDFDIHAVDGEVGSLEDIYFERVNRQASNWVVRYLVVNVGNWLIKDRVLVSPEAAETFDGEAQTLTLSLTKKEIEDSPDINTKKPISREKEEILHAHYNWTPYWVRDSISNVGMNRAVGVPPHTPPVAGSPAKAEAEEVATLDSASSTLRSCDEVQSYDIRALDDDIGHVEDFIIDPDAWMMRYIVVDTQDWIPGSKKTLVSPTWIDEISWEDAHVILNLTTEEIENAPRYDPDKMLNREYEVELYQFYDRPPYWE